MWAAEVGHWLKLADKCKIGFERSVRLYSVEWPEAMHAVHALMVIMERGSGAILAWELVSPYERTKAMKEQLWDQKPFLNGQQRLALQYATACCSMLHNLNFLLVTTWLSHIFDLNFCQWNIKKTSAASMSQYDSSEWKCIRDKWLKLLWSSLESFLFCWIFFC